MTQLVPSCIGEGCFLHAYCLNAFRLCETWEQAVTNSNVFLPHLCHHIIQAVAGNPDIAIHDASGWGGVSPVQLCKQMVLW